MRQWCEWQGQTVPEDMSETAEWLQVWQWADHRLTPVWWKGCDGKRRWKTA